MKKYSLNDLKPYNKYDTNIHVLKQHGNFNYEGKNYKYPEFTKNDARKTNNLFKLLETWEREFPKLFERFTEIYPKKNIEMLRYQYIKKDYVEDYMKNNREISKNALDYRTPNQFIYSHLYGTTGECIAQVLYEGMGYEVERNGGDKDFTYNQKMSVSTDLKLTDREGNIKYVDVKMNEFTNNEKLTKFIYDTPENKELELRKTFFSVKDNQLNKYSKADADLFVLDISNANIGLVSYFQINTNDYKHKFVDKGNYYMKKEHKMSLDITGLELHHLDFSLPADCDLPQEEIKTGLITETLSKPYYDVNSMSLQFIDTTHSKGIDFDNIREENIKTEKQVIRKGIKF